MNKYVKSNLEQEFEAFPPSTNSDQGHSQLDFRKYVRRT
jgi:hypothetical protein